MPKFKPFVAVATLVLFLLCSCAPVHQNIQPRVLKPANKIKNVQTKNKISVAAEPYMYPGQGLDYTKAGIHPLQVVVTNNSDESIKFSSESVVLHATDGNLYLTYTPQEASELVVRSHAIEEAAKGAITGAATGAAVGALVGLVVGSAFGVDTGDMAAHGAAYGGIAGAGGGAKTFADKLRSAATIEINNKALTQATVLPGFTKSGWLFFPGEVTPDELRLAISKEGVGKFSTFIFPINKL